MLFQLTNNQLHVQRLVLQNLKDWMTEGGYNMRKAEVSGSRGREI